MDKTTFDKAININNQIDYLENQKKIWMEAIGFKGNQLCLISPSGFQRIVDVGDSVIDFETYKQLALCEINSKLLDLKQQFEDL